MCSTCSEKNAYIYWPFGPCQEDVYCMGTFLELLNFLQELWAYFSVIVPKHLVQNNSDLVILINKFMKVSFLTYVLYFLKMEAADFDFGY